jgi:hypothetical protein
MVVPRLVTLISLFLAAFLSCNSGEKTADVAGSDAVDAAEIDVDGRAVEVDVACLPTCGEEGQAECGGDGCGGSCGECESWLECTEERLCKAMDEWSCVGFCNTGPGAREEEGLSCRCDHSCFSIGDCCPDVCEACPEEPDCCEGDDCHPPGCNLGEACETDDDCWDCSCIEGPTGDKICTMYCQEECPPSFECTGVPTDTDTIYACFPPCVPDCSDKECGDDGCEGSCGECDDGDPCTDDFCTDDGICENSPIWKPVVIWLLDTSTSMQYSVTGQEGELPACHEVREDGFDYQKSRWNSILEALTGTFNDYWCSYDDRLGDIEAEDYNAQPGHVAAHGTLVDGAEQVADGLFDEVGGQYKFGLMTFDPKPGTSNDGAGGFSYGEDKPSGFNYGIKSEVAVWGALVVPASGESAEETQAVADSIQLQLLPARPYSGSPLAPSLDDALFFAQNDPGSGPYDEDAGTGDPGHACRTRHLVFVTDGQPNLGEGTNGYPTSVVAAAALVEAGWLVHGVGFDMPPGTFPVLDEIAEAGGTGAAIVVDGTDDLRAQLLELLQGISGE